MRPELISGATHSDNRGRLDFLNDLDLSDVVRMYRILPYDTKGIRAWQGHLREQKWFYCLRGSFIVNLYPLSKIKQKPPFVIPEIYTLHADFPQVLKIPGGYANGFRAKEPDSELLVFSDKSLEDSKKDDIRFGPEEMPFVETN